MTFLRVHKFMVVTGFSFLRKGKTLATVDVMWSVFSSQICRLSKLFLIFTLTHCFSLLRIESKITLLWRFGRGIFSLWHFQVFFCFSYANFLDILLLQNHWYGRLLSTESNLVVHFFLSWWKDLDHFSSTTRHLWYFAIEMQQRFVWRNIIPREKKVFFDSITS